MFVTRLVCTLCMQKKFFFGFFPLLFRHMHHAMHDVIQYICARMHPCGVYSSPCRQGHDNIKKIYMVCLRIAHSLLLILARAIPLSKFRNNLLLYTYTRKQTEKQKSSIPASLCHDKKSFEGMGNFSGTGLTVNAGPAYLPFCCCLCS